MNLYSLSNLNYFSKPLLIAKHDIVIMINSSCIFYMKCNKGDDATSLFAKAVTSLPWYPCLSYIGCAFPEHLCIVIETPHNLVGRHVYFLSVIMALLTFNQSVFTFYLLFSLSVFLSQHGYDELAHTGSRSKVAGTMLGDVGS